MQSALNIAQKGAETTDLLAHLRAEFGSRILAEQTTCDGIPTLWVQRQDLKALLQELKDDCMPRFEMLFDITAIDERLRVHREGQPSSEFTVVYHLLSFSGNRDFRVKVPLLDSDLVLPSVIDIWPNANWYERETWDMFGIRFLGHPNLYRIVLPPTWKGMPCARNTLRGQPRWSRIPSMMSRKLSSNRL